MDGRLSEVLEEFCLLHEFAGKEGSTASARVGAASRHVAVVGLGPAAAAKPIAAWGASPFQVAVDSPCCPRLRQLSGHQAHTPCVTPQTPDRGMRPPLKCCSSTHTPLWAQSA